MQTVKYREILYAVAYKLGYDPLDPNFPRDEAQAIGTYIDQWVTRVYPAQDWPEWTKIRALIPDANHIVPWTPAAAFGHVGEELPRIWRPLAVYLVDPTTTYGANSTKFYLREEGIHCGYEHGTSVWIKYIEPPPRFTSVEWDALKRYQKDEVVYSLNTGDVYKSLSNNNLNHDPAVGFTLGGGGGGATLDGGSTFLATDVLQEKAISQFGGTAQDKIMKVYVNRLANASTTIIPDPPANGSVFQINVLDSTGIILGTSMSVGDGIRTLATITTDLANQLISALGAGWTITDNSATELSVSIENASDFQLANPTTGQDWPAYYANALAFASPLLYIQIQAYTSAASAAVVTPQIIKTTFSQDQLIAGALYSFTFRDLSGVEHMAEYQSAAEDGQDQIMAGILSAIPGAVPSDNYFEAVQVTSDATPSVTFTLNDYASLNSIITLPGSHWWEVVPFPLALAETVIRGAYADALKDWGQADKGAMEEQGVTAEASAAADKFTYSPTLPLTGQVSKSRYRQ